MTKAAKSIKQTLNIKIQKKTLKDKKPLKYKIF